MRFYIDMLDEKAKRDLIKNNSKLRDMVYDDLYETEMDYIGDQLSHIRHSLSDWSIGNCQYNYITVRDSLSFLDGLEELQETYCTLPDDMENDIKRTLSARDRFRNLDMSYGDLYQVSEWLDKKAQFYADCIAEYFTRCLDFDFETMCEYFTDFYAYERMDHNYYVENGKLYQVKEIK